MEYKNLDDHTLLQLIHRSNEEALSVLYDRYHRLVFSIALNALGQASIAEEVTQDVFLNVWKHAGAFDIQQSKVVTWLTSIARHRAIDILRQLRVRPESRSISWEDIAPLDPPDPGNLEQEVELAFRQQRIRFAISQLPDEQRLVIGLAFLRGMTHLEISEMLEQPLGTVKTRIRSGMLKLRQLLQDQD